MAGATSRADLELLYHHPQIVKAELAKWHRTAREKQLPPAGQWRIWVIQSGRGWG